MIVGSVSDATVVGISEKKAPEHVSGSTILQVSEAELTGRYTGDNDKDDEWRERHADRPEDQQRETVTEHSDDEGIDRPDPICQLAE